MEPQGRPYWSPSRVTTYLRCPEQYRRAYINRERIPPGVALVKGGAVHRAAEVNFKQKVVTEHDLPVRDMTEAAVAHVQGTVKAEGLLLTREEAARGVRAVEGDLIDRAVALTELLAKRVTPSIQPALVEQRVVIQLPHHRFDLLGYLDVADSEGRVRDLKTSGRRKTQDEVDRSDQLTFYDLGYRALTGRPPAGVTMDVLLDQKRPDVQTLHAVRDEHDHRVYLNRLNSAVAGVAAGSFPPAPLGAWWCSPRFCGYWQTCPYVNSERASAAQEVDV